MGRRKKKSRQGASAAREVLNLEKKPAPAAGQESGSPKREGAGPKPEPAPARERPGGVRPSTCLAGMFLTLVLGMYLGTLMPGVVAEFSGWRPPATAGGGAENAAPGKSVPEMTDAGPEKASPPAQKAQPAPDARMAARIREQEARAKADPASAAVWAELGNLYFDAGQIAQSIHAYEHSLAIEPKNPDVLTDLGIMYREAHEYEKALESFRRAQTINPTHVNSIFNEGVVLSMDLGRKDEGRKAWEKVLSLNPEARGPDGTPLSKMIEALR